MSRRILLISAVALWSVMSGVSLAGGGGAGALTPDTVTGQATYRCQGGVQVHITQYPGRARVDFAGQSQTLDLVGGGTYRNDSFSWTSQGRVSTMKNRQSGKRVLSGCVLAGG